jgi:hypothetical protein
LHFIKSNSYLFEQFADSLRIINKKAPFCMTEKGAVKKVPEKRRTLPSESTWKRSPFLVQFLCHEN